MSPTIPLSSRANAAWICAAVLRAEKYGTELKGLGPMLNKENILAGLRDDPNPGVRRLEERNVEQARARVCEQEHRERVA